MLQVLKNRDLDDLVNRLRAAPEASVALLHEVIDIACRRFPSLGQSEKTARIERLIQTGAWTDVALALIDLELPYWKIRRLAYDDGEWYCALSNQRELPDWLDQSIETRHANLALAMLCALVEAERISAPASRTSVPAVKRHAEALYDPACCENFS
jgi:hypothetical protein